MSELSDHLTAALALDREKDATVTSLTARNAELAAANDALQARVDELETPAPPPPPPPVPAGSVTATRVGTSVELRWTGLTPTEFGIEGGWATPRDDKWVFAEAVRLGVMTFTNLASSQMWTVYAAGADGKRYPAVVAPVVTVPPVPPSPSAGIWRTSGGLILNPAGKPQPPIGVNLSGPGHHTDWNQWPTLPAIAAAKRWGFTIIRLNCEPWAPPGVNADLDAQVAAITGAGMICQLTLTGGWGGYGGWWVPGGMEGLKAIWRAWAQKYKGNPLVWFDFLNEPGDAENPASDQWAVMFRSLLDTVRPIAPNVCVLEGGAYGQDIGYLDPSATKIDPARSAILRHGPSLARDYPNLVFSPHVYGQWQPNAYAKAKDFFARCRAAGLPLVIGEIGEVGWENGGIVAYTDAMNGVSQAALEDKVGVEAWHGQGKDGGDFGLVNGGHSIAEANADFSNLNNEGRRMRQLALAAVG